MLCSRILALCKNAQCAHNSQAFLGFCQGRLLETWPASSHLRKQGFILSASNLEQWQACATQLISARKYRAVASASSLLDAWSATAAPSASTAFTAVTASGDDKRRNCITADQWRGYARKVDPGRLSAVSPRPRPPKQPVLQVVAEDAVAVQPSESSASDVQVASVVGHSALIVTRPIEWGTVLLGYEQANRYTILDESGNVVALLAEEEGSLGRALGRQLLRTRRPFTATVFSPDGSQVVFRLRRPFYFINSSILIEDGQGEVVGEVHQRWHLWKRNYDLYIDRRQFAEISGGLLAWDFELKDAEGRTLALIDRNFSGFGKEIFTDAGKYVIHFGSEPEEAAQQLANCIHAQHPDRPAPPVTALATITTNVQVIPTSSGNQLAVYRPLALSERMIALAAAISIDYDYFSRHSYGHGVLSPFVHPPIIPFPVPMGGGAAGVEEVAAGADAAGADAAGTAGDIGNSPGMGPGPDTAPPASETLERDLGGDEWLDERDEGGDEGFGSDGGDGEGGAGLFDTLRDLFGE